MTGYSHWLAPISIMQKKATWSTCCCSRASRIWGVCLDYWSSVCPRERRQPLPWQHKNSSAGGRKDKAVTSSSTASNHPIYSIISPVWPTDSVQSHGLDMAESGRVVSVGRYSRRFPVSDSMEFSALVFWYQRMRSKYGLWCFWGCCLISELPRLVLFVLSFRFVLRTKLFYTCVLNWYLL